MTLRDVSKVAGVSTYTVSQALAGKPGVSQETRGRILSVARDLGYVPNRLAAALRGEGSRSIGVITASGRNQYYAMLVQAIDGVLQEHGFHAVTNDAMRSGRFATEAERTSVEDLLQQRVAAVVATYSLSVDSMRLLEAWGIPVVFVDSHPPAGYESYPFIGTKNYEASERVATYLHSLGLRSAAALAYPPGWNTRHDRERGFVETAEKLGLIVEVLESKNDSESACDTVTERFGRPADSWPDALYAMNTVLLHGAMNAFRRLGIKIPREVSVVAFDDFDWAELVDPPVTVIDQHIGAIGEAAGKAVLELVGGSPRSDMGDTLHVQIEPDLIIRGSCATKRSP